MQILGLESIGRVNILNKSVLIEYFLLAVVCADGYAELLALFSCFITRCYLTLMKSGSNLPEVRSGSSLGNSVPKVRELRRKLPPSHASALLVAESSCRIQ